MVGWLCSLISNSQQNMGLIRQFALPVFCFVLFCFIGGKESGWWESRAHPQARGRLPAAGDTTAEKVGVGLRGGSVAMTFVGVTYKLGR